MIIGKGKNVYAYFRPHRGYFYTRFKVSHDPQLWETPKEMQTAWNRYGYGSLTLAPTCLGTWEE